MSFSFSGILYISRIFFVIFFGLLFLLQSCRKKEEDKNKGKIKVGLVFDAAGKDDKSFNTASWVGASRAKEDFNIVLKDVEPGEPSAIEPSIRILAEQGFDLIIGVGFGNKPYIEEVSKEYPELKFAIVDVEVKGDNVASILFEEHQGAFLVGMIAAGVSKTGKIGFVGGMDIPLIHRFYEGYKAGALYINPKVEVYEGYAGVTLDAWNDPTKGKEIALAQYSRGADVVYAAAGATGLGVFDAAEEVKKFVIGNDSNQNYLKPGYVLTSMLKKVDVAVYQIIKDVVQGNFKPGIHKFDLKNKGLDYAIDDYNRNLIPESLILKVEKAKQDIIKGKLKVPDYYEKISRNAEHK
ncbi:BMP family ABC transporter substrate-binding protein [candidate division KSB1 bacterium]|nr:MAG: BMP family ABC transporter substrate-binding protein [candidate division KSB1 bacterium]